MACGMLIAVHELRGAAATHQGNATMATPYHGEPRALTKVGRALSAGHDRRMADASTINSLQQACTCRFIRDVEFDGGQLAQGACERWNDKS